VASKEEGGPVTKDLLQIKLMQKIQWTVHNHDFFSYRSSVDTPGLIITDIIIYIKSMTQDFFDLEKDTVTNSLTHGMTSSMLIKMHFV
jgi:hypothetical protein